MAGLRPTGLKRITAVLTTFAIGAVGAAGLVSMSPVASATASTTPPPPPHIMLIVDENSSYGSIIGSSHAPYINSLANKYSSATKWYSVQHTSYNDYVDLVSGSDQADKSKPYGATSVVDELSSSKIPWKAYMESMPAGSDCGAGSSTGNYDKGHNPFASFKTTSTTPLCNNVVPFPSSATNWVNDLDTSNPAFVWVTPNLCNDMHTQCTGNRVTQGDTWLSNNLQPVLSSQWYQNNGVVIITWDESTGSDVSNGGITGDSGGHIATLVISANSSQKYAGLGDHFGTLAGIENAYQVPCLGASCSSTHGDLSAAWSSTPGMIQGSVTGTSGPLMGANVTCTCPGTQTTTDINGNYTFSAVPPGTYNLGFAATSYNPQSVDNVSVAPGATTTVPPVQMSATGSVAVVQEASAASTAAGTTLAVPLNAATTAGNQVVVTATYETAATPAATMTVSDNATPTADAYTRAVTCTPSCATRVAADVWYVPSTVAQGGATTVTVTFSANVSAVVRVYEVSGVTQLDQSAYNSGSSSAPTATTGPTAAASEFAVGVIGWGGSGAESVPPASPPWTNDAVVPVPISSYKLNEQGSHALLGTQQTLVDSSTISSAGWAVAVASFS